MADPTTARISSSFMMSIRPAKTRMQPLSIANALTSVTRYTLALSGLPLNLSIFSGFNAVARRFAYLLPGAAILLSRSSAAQDLLARSTTSASLKVAALIARPAELANALKSAALAKDEASTSAPPARNFARMDPMN